jgi:CRP/FNR family transcriptional regulator, cyclic AMP receptor protein
MKQITTTAKNHDLDPHAFLSMIGKGRKMISFDKKSIVFAQGDRTDGLFFIQKGKVQLTVVSDAGKEATLGILNAGDFFGEGGLAGELLRMCSATTLTDCVLLHVTKLSMMLSLGREPKLSAMFTQSLLTRNARYQDDLIDQLFNSSEKRLARMLLLMAQFGKAGVSEKLIPRLSQETMAEMVGTTRSRVCFFLNRFRRHGYINYDKGDHLRVNSSLLNVVLHDEDEMPARTVNIRSTASTRPEPPTEPGEPPTEPGEPPSKNRAKRPLLPGVKQRRKAA